MKVAFFLYFMMALSLYAEPLALNEDRAYNLKDHMDVVKVSAEIPFSSVQNKDFFKNSSYTFSTSKNKNIYWARFQVKNTGHSRNWYLLLDHVNLDTVKFYSTDQNGKYTRQIAGDHYPFTKWSQKFSHPLFRFFLEKGETKTIYFFINTTSSIDFMPAIYDSRSLARREMGVEILQIFNFFVTFVFLGIFLFYFKKNKNKHFLNLVPIVIFYYLYIFVGDGSYYQFWPESPWLQDRIFRFVIIFSIYQFIYANLKFLQIKVNSRMLWYLFIAVMVAGIPGFYIFYEINYFFRSWMVIHAAVSLFLILISAFIIYRRGNNYVKYYLYFQIVIQAGVYVKVMNYFDILDPFEWRYNWPAVFFPIGILVLLKFAHEQYQKIFREKEDLDDKYNKLMNKLQQTGKKSRTTNIDKYQILSQISQMVDQNTIFKNEIFTLSKMAKFLGIRSDQLSEIINQEMEVSFNTFVNTIRIKKACELMEQNPDKNITHIFHESGFESKAPFNTAFREIMELTPSEFRNKILR